MDKKIERSNKDKILRRLAKQLKDNDFKRTKPTFYVREIGNLIEFIHIHKYSFSPSFRVHICVRVLNDPRDFIALLGIDSAAYGKPDSPSGKKYNFSYHVADETIDRCVNNIYEFINEVAEPWYAKWHDNSALIHSVESPLPTEDKGALKSAIEGIINEENVANSRFLLKIA